MQNAAYVPAMTDQLWVELRQLVDAAWEDKDVLASPPREVAEWGYLADTVVDHIYAWVKAAVDR